MPKISFATRPFQPAASAKIGMDPLVVLPREVSEQLPSRGMNMVMGTMNGFSFHAAVEPDGNGSHWFKLSGDLRDGAAVDADGIIRFEIEATKVWPEPKVPDDLRLALDSDPAAHETWADITPAARWDWIRWVSAAKLDETRRRRVQVACSKLNHGSRRPCCFNRNECTLTDA